MRVKVQTAAKALGISAQSVRLWLKSGKCPFGQAFRGQGKSYIYYINEIALNEYIGRNGAVCYADEGIDCSKAG